MAKKLKKGTRRLLIILIVIVIIFMIIAGALVYFFRDAIFNKPSESNLGDAFFGKFGLAPDVSAWYITDYSAHFAAFEPQIEAAMSEDATAEEKALGAYIIYRIGCLARETSLFFSKYVAGGGTATGVVLGSGSFGRIEVSGGMNMTATYYDIKYPFNKPITVDKMYDGTYTHYSAYEEYTQIPQDAVTGSNETAIKLGGPLLRVLLPMAKRVISDGNERVTWNGTAQTVVITTDGVTAEFKEKESDFTVESLQDIKQKEIDIGSARVYGDDWGDPYGLTAYDMSIHIITPDTILGDTVVITKHQGEDTKGKTVDYYEVDFEIDTETERGTEKSATYYAEQMYKAAAPDIFMTNLSDYYLHYTSLKINMSVFENGYFRTWSTEEEWGMGGAVSAIKLTAELNSYNDSIEAYCYDREYIMQGFVNRYYGNLSAVNRPMSALPFYDELKDYSAQAYGAYR